MFVNSNILNCSTKLLHLFEPLCPFAIELLFFFSPFLAFLSFFAISWQLFILPRITVRDSSYILHLCTSKDLRTPCPFESRMDFPFVQGFTRVVRGFGMCSHFAPPLTTTSKLSKRNPGDQVMTLRETSLWAIHWDGLRVSFELSDL